jgi:hypothetical protein
MDSVVPVSFGDFGMLVAAGVLAAAACGIFFFRKPELPATAAWIFLAGILCLALAAGKPVWNRPSKKSVAVMVDLSPSTRGATFRDAGFLSRRLHDLLGKTPYHLWGFADGPPVEFPPTLAEMPADQTRFAPVNADAIILFSDCQFDLPAWSPPVYVVVDSNLEQPEDGQVKGLRIEGNRLTAEITNGGPSRVAIFDGTAGEIDEPIGTGSIRMGKMLSRLATSASVQLNQNDLWPENDAMTIENSPPFASESWWVGGRAAADSNGKALAGWRSMPARDLPQSPEKYLAPAVIVLDNVAADQLNPTATDNLTQYVRDLGGSVVILGGDQAFTAGGYVGTALDALSPLASCPPDAALRWMVLVDSSGSMSADAGDVTRWQAASTAAVRLLRMLPPHDVVQIGQFSADLRWWSKGKNAQDTSALSLPPTDAAPIGPTDLEAALDHIAAETDGSMPTRLLVVSDCDVAISQPAQLSDLLKSKHIELYVLAIGAGSGLDTVRQITAATGGAVLEQDDVGQWYSSLLKLSRSAAPSNLMDTPITLRAMGEEGFGDGESIPQWNRTWLKENAEEITRAMFAESRTPMVATWKFGRGSVTAVAFSPDVDRAVDLASEEALKPRDPRFNITWETGINVGASIVATDGSIPINDLQFVLELAGDGAPESLPVEQTAPGLYSGRLPAPRQPAIATLRCGDQIVDRVAVPGCYPREFAHIGNDHEAMRKLAERSGGAVIWSGSNARLDFQWPPREAPLSPWLNGAGAVFIVAGLMRYRSE